MRVALVVPRYLPHPGGVERHVYELAQGLARAGVDVEVLTQERDARLQVVERDRDVLVRRFLSRAATPRYAIAPGLLGHLVRHGRRYDVLHAHNYHDLVPRLVALTHPRHLVVTPHYHPVTGGGGARILRRAHHAIAATALHSARTVVCVSAVEADALAQDVPAVTHKIVVVPNGVDQARIRNAGPLETDRPVILAIGRLEDYKRIDLVIRAAARVPGTPELVIVGGGPQEPALRRLAASSPAHIRFTGQVDDPTLHRWLRTAAVVVTMSEREAFGLTLLEAFAAGSRVVASDIPAHRETAAYGPPGAARLVPAGAAPAALTQALAAALAQESPPAAATRVPSWQEMADRTLELYGRTA